MNRWKNKLALLVVLVVAVMGIIDWNLLLKTGSIPFLNKTILERRDEEIKRQNRRLIGEGSILDRNDQPITEGGEPGKAAKIVHNAFSTLVGYNSALRGTSGLRMSCDELYTPDPGKPLDDLVGRDVKLTLDAELQTFCYEALEGKQGCVIVVDAHTGEILTMASRASETIEYQPDDIECLAKDILEPGEIPSQFDQENGTLMDYYNLHEGFFLDRTTQVFDAPGSIMKIVTAACLLENGMGDFLYDDTEGEFEIDGSVIRNVNRSKEGPDLDMETALNVSSNTYFAAAGKMLGVAKMERTMKAFGLGELIKCDWATLKSSYKLESRADTRGLAYISFGQGTMKMTPVHGAMFMMPVLNQGVLMEPHLLMIDGHTKVYNDHTMSPENAALLGDYLHNVAVSHGFDEKTYGRAYVKTGTMQRDGTDKNHLYYLCGLEDAGPEKKDLVLIVSENYNDSKQNSGALKSLTQEIAKYLVSG